MVLTSPSPKRRAFTLMELMLALGASAVLLVAVYGIFFKAVRLRDSATERTRLARLQARAVSVIRCDLTNALISGGKMAATLGTTADRNASRFPGFLKMTTTGGSDDSETLKGDLQEIEYYIANDESSADHNAGVLVRAVDHTLLAPVREVPKEERLLTGITSMEVEFYDGSTWQTSWEVTEESKTLPEAVRVRLLPAPSEAAGTRPAPIEITVPWTTASSIETTTTSTEGTTP